MVFVACADENLEFDTRYTFDKISSYNLPVPPDISPNSWRQKFHGGKYLYYLEQHAQKIIVFDIDLKRMTREISFHSKGPDDVGEVFSFSVFSHDSIVLASGPFTFNYIVNREGRKVGKFDVEIPEGIDQEVDHTRLFSRYFADLSNDPDNVYFLQRIPYTAFYEESTEHYPILKLSKVTGEYSVIDFKYPKSYFEQRLPEHMTFNHDSENLYFGLIGDHNLYVINKSTEMIEKYYLKSEFAPEQMKNTLDQSSPIDVMMYDAVNPRYTALLPDPYQKLFYRIVCLPPTDLSLAKEKTTQLHYCPDRFSIMVLDEKMNVILEQVLPERQYFPHGIFVTEDGVHIPKTHPEYFVQRGDESSFEYEVFRLSADGTSDVKLK